MRAHFHVRASRIGGQAGTHGKAPAHALGHGHDVGRSRTGPFMRPQLAGAPGAALDLVIDQQQAMIVAQLTKTTQADIGDRAHAALALHGLDQNGSGFFGDSGFERLVIAEGDLVKPLHARPEAFKISRIAARIDGPERAPVEGPGEGDDAVAVRAPVGEVVMARGLQRALHRLGPRIGEEDPVGEAVAAILLRQFNLAGHAEHVRRMPQRLGLGFQRRHRRRVAVAQPVHRDAGDKIEIARAAARVEIHSLAPLEIDIGRRIGVHQWSGHARKPPNSDVTP